MKASEALYYSLVECCFHNIPTSPIYRTINISLGIIVTLRYSICTLEIELQDLIELCIMNLSGVQCNL